MGKDTCLFLSSFPHPPRSCWSPYLMRPFSAWASGYLQGLPAPSFPTHPPSTSSVLRGSPSPPVTWPPVFISLQTFCFEILKQESWQYQLSTLCHSCFISVSLHTFYSSPFAHYPEDSSSISYRNEGVFPQNHSWVTLKSNLDAVNLTSDVDCAPRSTNCAKYSFPFGSRTKWCIASGCHVILNLEQSLHLFLALVSNLLWPYLSFYRDRVLDCPALLHESSQAVFLCGCHG